MCEVELGGVFEMLFRPAGFVDKQRLVCRTNVCAVEKAMSLQLVIDRVFCGYLFVGRVVDFGIACKDQRKVARIKKKRCVMF